MATSVKQMSSACQIQADRYEFQFPNAVKQVYWYLIFLITNLCNYSEQVVYILDQVKALEEELLLRIKQQGLNVKPQIVVVSSPALEEWLIQSGLQEPV